MSTSQDCTIQARQLLSQLESLLTAWLNFENGRIPQIPAGWGRQLQQSGAAAGQLIDAQLALQQAGQVQQPCRPLLAALYILAPAAGALYRHARNYKPQDVARVRSLVEQALQNIQQQQPQAQPMELEVVPPYVPTRRTAKPKKQVRFSSAPPALHYLSPVAEGSREGASLTQRQGNVFQTGAAAEAEFDCAAAFEAASEQARSVFRAVLQGRNPDVSSEQEDVFVDEIRNDLPFAINNIQSFLDAGRPCPLEISLGQRVLAALLKVNNIVMGQQMEKEEDVDQLFAEIRNLLNEIEGIIQGVRETVAANVGEEAAEAFEETLEQQDPDTQAAIANSLESEAEEAAIRSSQKEQAAPGFFSRVGNTIGTYFFE